MSCNQQFEDCITGRNKLEIETDSSRYNSQKYVFMNRCKENRVNEVIIENYRGYHRKMQSIL